MLIKQTFSKSNWGGLYTMAKLKSLTINDVDYLDLAHQSTLIAYGQIQRSGEADQVYASGTSTPISDIFVPDKCTSTIVNYNKTVLSYEAGTFRIYPQNVVRLIELNILIGGGSNTGCTGLTFYEGLNNELPTGSTVLTTRTIVPCEPNRFCTLLSQPYIITLDDAASSANAFYVNPVLAPYNGNFTGSSAGLPCSATIKVYSKYM